MKPRLFLIAALLSVACALPESALAITGKPSTVTFPQGGTQRIYVFARGDNGHLVVNYWNGTRWQWSDRGLPSDVSSIADPSAISCIDGAGQRRIYVFVATSKSGLAVHYWNGSQWQWAYQGVPSGATDLHVPTAITYVDSAGHRRTDAFCVDYWGGLFVNYWNGFSWRWAYLGGDGSPVDFSELGLSAITYVENGTRQIRVFRSYVLGGLSATFGTGQAGSRRIIAVGFIHRESARSRMRIRSGTNQSTRSSPCTLQAHFASGSWGASSGHGGNWDPLRAKSI